VALRGTLGGWLHKTEAKRATDALEAMIASQDPAWLEQWKALEEHSQDPKAMVSSHGRTLENFGGHFTRLYLFATETIRRIVR
jgi:hypothetical protein